jgi:hypothetical protein
MGTVKDTYIRYEAAQDQFVGRIVAGLDGLRVRSLVCPLVTKYAHTEMELEFRLTGIPPHVLLL